MNKYVYVLKSNLLEDVIAKYIDYITNPLNEWRQYLNVTVDGQEIYNNGDGIKPMPLKRINNYDCMGEKEIMILPKPRYNTAKSEVIGVAHTLHKFRYNADENGYFTVSSKLLAKASNRYAYIIYTMEQLRIIQSINIVIDGQYKRTLYKIMDEKHFHLQKTSTIRYRDSIQRVDEYEAEKHKIELDKVIKATSRLFVERYNKSLSKLTIDKEAACEYVNRTYGSEECVKSKKCRLHTIDKISSGDYNDIRSIDDNERIYHIGTEMQRDIKKFTNISYSLDCKNSHPFLFSYLLVMYVIQGDIDIDEDFSDKEFHRILLFVIQFLLINKGILNHYTFFDFVCKSLNDRRLEKQVLAKTHAIETVKEDVWKYIYDVATGKLWDMFVEAKHEDRTTVKQNVFASVMYSYATKREKALNKEKAKWVDMFKELYPTVYSYIREIKLLLRKQCKDRGRTITLKKPIVVRIGKYEVTYTERDEVMLPMLLMRLESKIFTKILTKLFNKRVTCFGIHDAVAVIKSPISEDEVKNVMLNEYKKYGLIPTLSVDHY